MSTPWTPEEDAFITNNFRAMSIKEMSAHLGRSEGAVRNRRLALGVSGAWKFRWTAEKEEQIREAYAARTHKDGLDQKSLAEAIGCSLISLQRKARELGLTGHWGTLKDEHGRYPSQRPKYATEDERRKAQSERLQKMWQERPHPRGATGIKHTDEAKRAMAAGSRRYWESLTPEERTARARRAVMTKMKRHGTAGPVYGKPENAYSRSRGGKRDDLGGMYFRSAWEANYARYLNWLMDQDDIKGWEYEADTFVFEGYTRGAMTYRPDFKVTEKDGRIVYHEVKGWMDGPSKTRLKRMAKHYPDVEVIVIGEPEYRAIAKWKDMIPNWE